MKNSYTKFSFLFIALLAGIFSHAQSIYYPHFKDSVFKCDQSPAAGKILQVTGNRYDLTAIFSNNETIRRLSKNRPVLGRFNQSRFWGAAPRLFWGEGYYPTQIINSPLHTLDEDRYLQWQVSTFRSRLRIYNLENINYREAEWRGLSFLNQNFVYFPPYAYFLGQRTARYLKDSTGARGAMNERFVNTDSLYLLRLNMQSLKLDTLELFNNPVSRPYKTLYKEMGFLKFNPTQSSVEQLTHYDTLRTYQIGQRTAVSEEFFPKRTNLNKSLRSNVLGDLFLNPGDTVYRRIYWEGQQNPTAVVPYAINDGLGNVIFDTLRLPTTDFYIDQESKNTPIHVRNFKNRVYMAANGSATPSAALQVHLFCYPVGSEQMLWKQVLLKDSVRSLVTDMHISPQGELWIAATVFGPPSPVSGFYINHTPVMLRHNVKALDRAQQKNVSIYPNPSGEIAFFQSQKAWSSIDLIGLSGKIIRTYQYQPGEILNIPVEDLRSGFYLLHLSNDQGDQVVRRLMVR